MAAQNPTHTTTSAKDQTEGMDTSSSPMQANTAVTTDGFKGDNETTQQQQQPQDDSIVVPIADDTGAVEGQDPQQQGQKQQQQQQQGTAGKLRSVFGRSKKGSEEVEGQGKGEEDAAKKHVDIL